jgi:hypothetical protein
MISKEQCVLNKNLDFKFPITPIDVTEDEIKRAKRLDDYMFVTYYIYAIGRQQNKINILGLSRFSGWNIFKAEIGKYKDDLKLTDYPIGTPYLSRMGYRKEIKKLLDEAQEIININTHCAREKTKDMGIFDTISEAEKKLDLELRVNTLILGESMLELRAKAYRLDSPAIILSKYGQSDTFTGIATAIRK